MWATRDKNFIDLTKERERKRNNRLFPEYTILQLQFPDYNFTMTVYRIQFYNYNFQITILQLQFPDYNFPITSYRVQCTICFNKNTKYETEMLQILFKVKLDL